MKNKLQNTSKNLRTKCRERVFRNPIKLTTWIFLFLLWTPLSAQNNGNNIILGINRDDTSVFFMPQAIENNEKTILWDNDKSTSRWMISIKGVNFNLKDTAWKTVEKISEFKYRMPYSDDEYTIEQVLEFSEDRLSGELKLKLINVSEDNIMLKSSMLLDTYLGEENNKPFILPDGSIITTETEFTNASIPLWLAMAQSEDSFQLTLDFNTRYLPERIIMANYYRLKTKPWAFSVEENRSFMTLYDMRKDSALLIEYPEVLVSTGKSVEFSLNFTLSKSIMRDNISPAIEVHQQDLQEPVNPIYGRLESLNEILDLIDILEKDISRISEESISEIETKVSEQEKLRTEYESP